MEKITYAELATAFREHERTRAPKTGDHLHGAIVFTEDSFLKPYSLEARTYLVSSKNKAYRPHMGGYSIFASAADVSDSSIRLDYYMADERGGPDGWKVDYCYLTKIQKYKTEGRGRSPGQKRDNVWNPCSIIP